MSTAVTSVLCRIHIIVMQYQHCKFVIPVLGWKISKLIQYSYCEPYGLFWNFKSMFSQALYPCFIQVYCMIMSWYVIKTVKKAICWEVIIFLLIILLSPFSKPSSLVGRDFLTLRNYSKDEIETLLWTAKDLKTRIKDKKEVN